MELRPQGVVAVRRFATHKRNVFNALCHGISNLLLSADLWPEPDFPVPNKLGWHKLEKLDRNGKWFLEDRKCNFDVEIGTDMLIDEEQNRIESFVLWSGDSDFADPVKQLLNDGQKVFLFATARRVSAELNELEKRSENHQSCKIVHNHGIWSV